jgi:hypothetical protein
MCTLIVSIFNAPMDDLTSTAKTETFDLSDLSSYNIPRKSGKRPPPIPYTTTSAAPAAPAATAATAATATAAATSENISETTATTNTRPSLFTNAANSNKKHKAQQQHPQQQHLCSFTNRDSVDGQLEGKGCCNATENDCFLVCTQCSKEPMKRCVPCHGRLAKAIKDHKDSKAAKKIIHCNQATKILLSINWEEVNKTKTIPKTVTADGQKIKVPIKLTDRDNEFEWKIECPCCGSIKLPSAPDLPLKDELSPSTNNIKIHHIEVKQLAVTRDSHKPFIKSSLVELVIATPLVDSDAITSIQHRGFGPGDGSCVVFHSKPDHWVGKDDVHRIITTPNENNTSELLALSSINYDSFCDKITNTERMEYMKLVQCSVLPSFEIPTSNTKKRRQQSSNVSGGTRHVNLRNNRTSGAGGVSNGMHIDDLQIAHAGAHLQGAHCRRHNQTVTIALQDSNGLITSTPNFYAASSKRSFVSKIQTSSVMKGCEAKGVNIVEALLDEDNVTVKSSHIKREKLIEIHLEFTIHRINTAYLYKALAEHPKLRELGYSSVSSIATRNILASWEAARSFVESVDVDGSEETDTDDDFGADFNEEEKKKLRAEPPYDVGERVWYRVGADGDTSEYLDGATILSQIPTKEGEERKYNIHFSDSDAKGVLGEYSLSGEPGFGKYTDDDTPICMHAEYLKVMNKLQKKYNCLDPLLIFSARGNYNAVFDAVSAHRDNFGDTKKGAVEATLENAIDVPFDTGSSAGEKRKIPPSGKVASFDDVPGALLMIRLGIATIRDRFTEILELSKEYHCVIRQEKEKNEDRMMRSTSDQSQNSKKTRNQRKKRIRDAISRVTYNRGCWIRGKWYGEGGSILDWGSRYLGQSCTAVALRNRSGGTRTYRRRHRDAMRENDLRRRARQEGQGASRRDIAQRDIDRAHAYRRNQDLNLV